MNIMKWLAVLALASTTPALAADNEQTAPFSWTGLYAGIDVGYGFGGEGQLADAFCDGVTPGRCVEEEIGHPNFGDPGTFVATTSMADFVGGGHLGFNQQFDGGFVLGGEMDLGMGGTSEGHFTHGGNFPDYPLFPHDPNPNAIGEINLCPTGSARVRAGFAMDRLLPYVTGGLAYARYEATYSNSTDPNAPRFGKGSFIGWTVGAGLDYALTDSFIIGTEYRFTDYGKDTLYLENPALDADQWAFNSSLTTHDIRVKASLKF